VTFSPEEDSRLSQAADMIWESRSCVVFTGAGLSVPSGIPDFRSASTGLWNHFDPMEVASLSAFRYRPRAFYDWIRPLALKSLDSHPNPAHLALARLEEAGYLRTLITQNIDGFHQAAGSSNVIELHGSLKTLICLDCGNTYELNSFKQSWLLEQNLPACRHCKTNLKPEIVLYEEMLPQDAWERAERACEKADVFLIAGTSLEVMPAGGLPILASNNGARIIVMNLSPTRLDGLAELILSMDVETGLPELFSRVIG